MTESRSAPPDPWAVLPHAPPFVHIDRLLEVSPGTRARALRLVTAGEGTASAALLLEAMTQLAGIAWLGAEPRAGALVAGVRDVRVTRPAAPGEAVEVEVRLLKVVGNLARAEGTARVGTEEVARAEMTLTREAP